MPNIFSRQVEKKPSTIKVLGKIFQPHSQCIAVVVVVVVAAVVVVSNWWSTFKKVKKVQSRISYFVNFCIRDVCSQECLF